MSKMDLKSSHNKILLWFMEQFPEIVKQMDQSHHFFDDANVNPYHVEDRVWTHSLMVFKNSQIFSTDNHYIKWTALLHDIGKPISREIVQEKKRVRFFGHEGISAYMAIDILNRTQIAVKDKIEIFRLIAMHATLFNFIDADGKVKESISKTFIGEKILLQNLVEQVRNDSIGRFFNEDIVKDQDFSFVKNLPEAFAPIIDTLPDHEASNVANPKLTILIGPPCARKSTWVDNNRNNSIVISRDDLVDKFAKKNGYKYTQAFEYLNDNPDIEKNEIADVLQKSVNSAKDKNSDVIIDITSMSKKSRSQWIKKFKGHNKRAILFLTGFEELLICNENRSKKNDKIIPKELLINMLRGFYPPMYSEGFSQIQYNWND